MKTALLSALFLIGTIASKAQYVPYFPEELIVTASGAALGLYPGNDINDTIVKTSWFGDLDHDNKPDCLFDDCPEEMNCRASLFLSSKAKPGKLLQKVCERQYPID